MMSTQKRKCRWERDIDCCTGKLTGAMPFCPSCNEPLYETDRCVFCGQEIDQDDDKLREWLKPPEVKTMRCFSCGGTMEYVESKYNGHKHGRCINCGLSFIE